MDAALEITPWALLPLFAIVVVVLTVRHHWSQRSEAGGGALLVLAAASGWWALTQLLALLVHDFEAELLLSKLQYVGIAIAPFAWLWFSLDYTGRGRLLWGPLGLLGLVPLVTIILAFSNDSHGLLWEEVALRTGFPELWVVHGAWFEVQTTFAYALVVTATGVLLWHHAQSPRHRSRMIVALAAPAVVVLPNLLYLSPLQPGPWIDLTPTGFALANAVLAWGLLRGGRLLTAPVARTIVMEEMRDPVLVLDRRGHIIDLNRAAEDVLGLEPEGPVPVALGTAWAVSHRRATRSPLPPNRVALPTAEGGERTFETTMTALGPRGGHGRTVLVLRDVTERDRMERELRDAGEALRAANAELERLANTDVLTGLANRRHFMGALEREVERSHRYGRPLSLILLDLDEFKGVNDTHGHGAGDEVLRAAGAALREVSREIDVPSRLGGEELAILLPETGVEGAAVVAERLRAGIARKEHPAPDGMRFRVTASLGVAGLGGTVRTAEALLHAADEALYAAKDAGRNRVVVAEPDPLLREESAS